MLRVWARGRLPFEPADHVALAERLGVVDYERGAKMGGSGYWLYRGDGALLEWATLNYFVEAHLRTAMNSCCPPIS